MRDAIKRYVDAAQSLTEVPRERAERVARRLAGNGMIDPSQIRSVASDLVERSRENRRRIAELVASEIGRQVSRLGLATKADLERLGRRISALEFARPGNRSRPSAPKSKKKPASRAKAKPTPKKTSRSNTRRKPSSKG
jgi:polyhydroxyalkanoate synthesis regulator phasin